MSKFSEEFEETISGLVKDSKTELKEISITMSSEEIKKKKEDLIQGLEAKKTLLLEQHQDMMEKIRKMQQDAAKIHREGVSVEEQLQQLKSGPFAIAKEPRKKVNFQHISKKTVVIPFWLQSSSFFAIGLVLEMSFKIYLSISRLILNVVLLWPLVKAIASVILWCRRGPVSKFSQNSSSPKHFDQNSFKLQLDVKFFLNS